MKYAEREKWWQLALIEAPMYVDYDKKETHSGCLCMFCKYAEWSGVCTEPELDCLHPLSERVDSTFYGERVMEVWEGSDCFLFAPDVTWDMAVEWISQTLQGYDVNMITKAGMKETL